MSIPGLSITELDEENVIDVSNPATSLNFRPTTTTTTSTTSTTTSARGTGLPGNGVGVKDRRGGGQALVQMPSSPIPPLDLGQPCLRGMLRFYIG